jgi:hypothetical protein
MMDAACLHSAIVCERLATMRVRAAAVIVGA